MFSGKLDLLRNGYMILGPGLILLLTVDTGVLDAVMNIRVP
jgi:hypothetical protein